MTADTLEALRALAWNEARRLHLAHSDDLCIGCEHGHEHLFDSCPHPDCVLVRPGGVPQPKTKPLIDMDPRSRLIADFVLAIDFETKNLKLDPALAAIERYDQSARPGGVETPPAAVTQKRCGKAVRSSEGEYNCGRPAGHRHSCGPRDESEWGAVEPPAPLKEVLLPYPRDYWKCFHCGEVFITEEQAEKHFGPRDPTNPLHARNMTAVEPPARWACLACSTAAGVVDDPTKHISHAFGEPCPRVEPPAQEPPSWPDPKKYRGMKPEDAAQWLEVIDLEGYRKSIKEARDYAIEVLRGARPSPSPATPAIHVELIEPGLVRLHGVVDGHAVSVLHRVVPEVSPPPATQGEVNG